MASLLRLTAPRFAVPPPSLRLTTSTTTALNLRRPFSSTIPRLSASDENASEAQSVDGLAEGGAAKGRTGGGEKLESSSPNAPPQPKISNLSVPGSDQAKDLTKEQKEEVDRHNKEFEKKHDRGNEAAADKVNPKFWSGGGGD